MKASSRGANSNHPGGRWHHRGGINWLTNKPAEPYRSHGDLDKDTDNAPKGNNSPFLGELRVTRQQSRASLFSAAYQDAKLSFEKMPRRQRRELARNGAKMILKAHRDVEDVRVVTK